MSQQFDPRSLRVTRLQRVTSACLECLLALRRDLDSHERQALKRQLGDADVTAAARQAAEKKVGELEDAIADMRQRTLRGMAEVQRQNCSCAPCLPGRACVQSRTHWAYLDPRSEDEAEQSRDLFLRSLEGTQQRLQQEEEARKASDHQALLMRLDWQRMNAALELERLIKQLNREIFRLDPWRMDAALKLERLIKWVKAMLGCCPQAEEAF
eukprot:scaffold25038_cov18-Tisochrysis_lutea.AAC.1